MTGDYLKQLQLTKQLEQKTKEAGKNRKEAEESMAEAEKAVATAKGFDADVAEAEKWFVESGHAFQQKDYKQALSLAKKSIESSESSKRLKVSSIIEAGERLLELFDEKDRPRELTSSIQKTKDILAEGKMEDALVRSREIWDAVERFANSKVADTLGSAQSLILMAEKLGITTEGEIQMLVQARKSLDQGDYGSSISQLKESMETTSSALRNAFQSRADALQENLAYSKEIEAEAKKAEDTLKKAHLAANQGDFEGGFSNLGIAESETRVAVSKGLQTKFDSLRQRATNLKDYGMDVTAISSDIAKGKELARTEKVADSVETWRRIEAGMRSMEMEQTLILMGKLRVRLLLAKKLGVDVNPVLSKLDESKKMLTRSDFPASAAKVGEAEKLLELTLEGYRDVEEELNKTRTLITQASIFKINLNDAKRKVESSRSLVLKRDFVRAAEQLQAAQEEVHRAVQAHLGGDIMRAEMKVTMALKVGADITEESALLEEIVSRTKSGQYAGVKDAIEICIRDVDRKIFSIAERTVREAKNILDAYSGPINISTHRNTLFHAGEALKDGQPIRAYDLAVGVNEAIKRDEKGALDRKLEEANHLLQLAREIGSESVTLTEKFAKAEDLRSAGNIPEGLKLTAEIIQFARSIIKEELNRQLAQLSQSVALARKNGIEVLQPERKTEEASRALSKGDLDKGYAFLHDAESTLERLTTVHSRIYERVVEITAMLREADGQSLDTSRQAEMLAHAKKLFEAGKYEEALPAIAKTFVETEKIVAPFMAPKKAQEARDLIAVAKRLGFDVAAPQKRIESAERMIEKKEYAAAMISIREVGKTVMSVLVRGAEKELLEVRDLMERAKESESDTTSANQIVIKAESLLREKRVYDALRAIEMAKNELDQSLLMSEKAQDTLERAQSVITDAQEFGVPVNAALELLRQARNYNKMGRHGIAHELAKKAGDQASIAATEMVHQRLRKTEMNYRPLGLEGPDLDSILRLKKEVESRLEARKFREATALLKNFEEELEKVKAQKELAARSLKETEGKVLEAKRKGLSNPDIDVILAQAKQRMDVGAFYDSFALTTRCADELKGQLEHFERRMEELEALKHEVEQLEGEMEAAPLKEIVEQARKSIASLDFESATLQIRRGRTAAQEARAQIEAERVKALENMLGLAKELKIEENSIPVGAKKALDQRKAGKPVDLRRLREAVEALQVVLQKRIEGRIKEVEAKVKHARSTGADVSASEEFLLKAHTLETEGKWRGAVNTVAEAEKFIGVALDAKKLYIETRLSVEAKIENARKNGLELKESIALYREAERIKEKDHMTAHAKMKEALEAAERAADEFMPDIQVDINFLGELVQGQWTKAQLNLANDAKAMAREVSVTISGDLEARGLEILPKLRGGERRTVGIEVMPKWKGVVHVVLSLECKPVLSNDRVGYDSEFDIEVA